MATYKLMYGRMTGDLGASLVWDAGKHPSGIYVIKAYVGKKVATKWITLVR